MYKISSKYFKLNYKVTFHTQHIMPIKIIIYVQLELILHLQHNHYLQSKNIRVH